MNGNVPGNAYYEPPALYEDPANECTCWLIQNQPGFAMNDLCAACRRELNAMLDEEHAAEIQAFFDEAPLHFELGPLEVAAIEEANKRIEERKIA